MMTNASAERRMNKENNNSNDLQTIITQGLNKIKEAQGSTFDLEKVNLAELERLTGISRSRLRRLKKNGFIVKPHGRIGTKSEKTVLSSYTDQVDSLLRSNVTNAKVIFGRLRKNGYKGSLTQVRVYIEQHRDLIPPKRKIVSPQGNRGRRYRTDPGESYQMDWGFVTVDSNVDAQSRLACFVMICHSCGTCFIEFFPNAKQENLFIGMIHAFGMMGVPRYVLTDNMKSVVLHRDSNGSPVWQKDYERFMNTIGFETKLCRPRHPFTKGASERLVRFVKQNFLQGRIFTELTDLNYQAQHWCNEQNSSFRRSMGWIPIQQHNSSCINGITSLKVSPEIQMYLAPLRKISFDGFVNYEGRRFGIPYTYAGHTCRVMRDGYTLRIYDPDMKEEIVHHDVTWSRRDAFCKDQYPDIEPEEQPTAPVKDSLRRKAAPDHDPWFDQFNLEEGRWHE
jgi:transposase